MIMFSIACTWNRIMSYCGLMNLLLCVGQRDIDTWWCRPIYPPLYCLWMPAFTCLGIISFGNHYFSMRVFAVIVMQTMNTQQHMQCMHSSLLHNTYHTSLLIHIITIIIGWQSHELLMNAVATCNKHTPLTQLVSSFSCSKCTV